MSKSAKTITTLFKALPIDKQSSLLNALGKLHYSARDARLKAIEAEKQKLKAKIGWEDTRTFFKQTRAKPAPKYRSKKDKRLTWSGRGSVPRWMREEMKVLKLKPDAFLISRR